MREQAGAWTTAHPPTAATTSSPATSTSPRPRRRWSHGLSTSTVGRTTRRWLRSRLRRGWRFRTQKATSTASTHSGARYAHNSPTTRHTDLSSFAVEALRESSAAGRHRRCALGTQRWLCSGRVPSSSRCHRSVYPPWLWSVAMPTLPVARSSPWLGCVPQPLAADCGPDCGRSLRDFRG